MTTGISLSPPSGFIPPITEFKGTLGNVYKNPVKGNYGTRDVIFFENGDIEIITATSPSLDNEFTVQVNYTEDSDNTRWEALRKSLTRFMPDEAEGEISWFIGRVFHWKWMPAPLRSRNEVTDEWETKDGDCWQVEAIEGLVNRTVTDTDNTLRDTIIAEVINSKTEADALMAFHQHEGIRSMNGYADAMTEITNGTLLSSYESEGLITVDDNGVWHISE